MLAKELVSNWNRTAHIKKPSVTAQGWLKKTECRRDAQNCSLRRMKPGTKSLLSMVPDFLNCSLPILMAGT